MANGPALPLAPVTRWNLEYAAESCRLIRHFGDPARPVTLVLERVAPNAGLSLLVIGGPLRSEVGIGRAKAAFLPFADHRFEDGQVAQRAGSKDTALYWTRVDFLPGWKNDPLPRKITRMPRDLGKEAAIRTLEATSAEAVTALKVEEPGGRKTVLQTGSLGRAIAMMRDCGRDQLADWGVDPDLQDKVVQVPFGKQDLSTFFTDRDYPTKAEFEGEQAIISARLLVGADGKVTRCTSLTPYKAPEFGTVVCRNLSRATFMPAELADGTRVPSFVVTQIRFQMPQ